jgi:Family of unknown function (DUF6599)
MRRRASFLSREVGRIPCPPSQGRFRRVRTAWVLLGVSFLPLASCKRAPTEVLTMNELSLKLPRAVAAWTQSGGPKFVGPEDIFNYMDGGGELYLGYRFRRLEVQTYSSADQGEILVELYWMESSDDAYGLLSLDWGGEAVALAPPMPGSSSLPETDGPRALYGAGLLRLWSGNLFARIMADHETSASKKAVQALGQAIAAGRSTPPRPELIEALPARVGSRFLIRQERVTFLRSHLVLNSVYFLSSDNLLDLTPDCEVATTTYGQGAAKAVGSAKPPRLMLARYANETAATNALTHFRQTYLPDKLNGPKPSLLGDNGVVAIEDGWMGFARSGRGLALVFESSDEASARLFLSESTRILAKREASHE